jgi:hypothetical protein
MGRPRGDGGLYFFVPKREPGPPGALKDQPRTIAASRLAAEPLSAGDCENRQVIDHTHGRSPGSGVGPDNASDVLPTGEHVIVVI